jgi:hypothetical protein
LFGPPDELYLDAEFNPDLGICRKYAKLKGPDREGQGVAALMEENSTSVFRWILLKRRAILAAMYMRWHDMGRAGMLKGGLG